MSALSYPMPEAVKASARLNPQTYAEKYQQSIADPKAFWAEEGKRISWFSPYSQVKKSQFRAGRVGHSMVRRRYLKRLL